MYDFMQVLEYWFGRSPGNIDVISEKSSLWWKKDVDVDQYLRENFSVLLDSLSTGELDHWKDEPEGILAMIIVADQFSRNIYRDTARAFAQDEFALGLALDCIDAGMDKRFRSIERVFLYMPFEHSESLAMQEKSIALFTKLLDEVEPEELEKFKGYLEFAEKHFDIINEFGRFPHRNKILDRKSTQEEAEFLKKPGSSF